MLPIERTVILATEGCEDVLRRRPLQCGVREEGEKAVLLVGDANLLGFFLPRSGFLLRSCRQRYREKPPHLGERVLEFRLLARERALLISAQEAEEEGGRRDLQSAGARGHGRGALA